MPTLLIYGLIALGIIGGVAGLVAYERKAGGDSVRADLQPKLASCQTQIASLAEETKQKQATSAQALRKAEGRAKVWEDNSARLRAVLTSRKPSDPQDCKAAWAEIRKP